MKIKVIGVPIYLNGAQFVKGDTFETDDVHGRYLTGNYPNDYEALPDKPAPAKADKSGSAPQEG